MKNILKTHLGLMVYRATPLENGYSPAELLIGCKLRTTIPAISEQLKPRLPDYSRLCEKEESMRAQQKNNFDQHHRAKTLEPLLPGETVWLPDCSSSGKVVEQTAPRSFVIQTSEGVYRRNCRTPFRCLCQIQRTSVKLVANQLLILTLPKLAVVIFKAT